MGRRLPAPRWPRPSWRTGSAPAPTTGCAFRRPDGARGVGRHHPARAAAGLRGAGRAPRRRALRRAGRRHGDARRCSASRCRCCAHPLADPAKGTGIAMVCTFGDTTDVTWWRELRPADPGGARPGRPAAGHSAARDHRPGRPRRLRSSWPGRRVPRARQRVTAAGRGAGDLLGEPRAGHPPGEVLREGRPAAGDRHHPAVVPAQRRPRRGAAAGRCSTAAGSSAGTRRTCGPATRTGWPG